MSYCPHHYGVKDLGFLFIMHLKARGSDKQICRACILQLQHLHHRLEGFPGSQQASPSDFQQTCLKMFLSYLGRKEWDPQSSNIPTISCWEEKTDVAAPHGLMAVPNPLGLA